MAAQPEKEAPEIKRPRLSRGLFMMSCPPDVWALVCWAIRSFLGLYPVTMRTPKAGISYSSSQESEYRDRPMRTLVVLATSTMSLDRLLKSGSLPSIMA